MFQKLEKTLSKTIFRITNAISIAFMIPKLEKPYAKAIYLRSFQNFHLLGEGHNIKNVKEIIFLRLTKCYILYKKLQFHKFL